MARDDLRFDPPPPERGIYSNRTLNMRSIKAIGYDMDYTLVHYNFDMWEQRAYERIKHKLADSGWPVEDLEYQPGFLMRGLILDTELGNIVKANRFGYIKSAFHGMEQIPFSRMRDLYSRTLVELKEDRWVFLNTLFTMSEACMFAQLVEKLDAGELGEAIGYADLRKRINRALDEAHAEGALKQEILADPDSFVMLDPDTPLALLDQREAGHKLVLITNSEWDYTRRILSYAFDRFLPEGMTWRDLFHLVIMSARKPSFFADPNPAFRVVNEEGLLEPVVGGLREGERYVGGNAGMVEELWGLAGEEILYVGDHVFADVTVSKNVLRWRTALIVRELEGELKALGEFEEKQRRLAALMAEKEELEYQHNRVRLELLRRRNDYGPRGEAGRKALRQRSDELWNRIQEIDSQVAPLAQESDSLMSPNWGLIMRAGNDKSHFARQVENYADIYMSRVSNFLFQTPFVYLRSARSSLPHDAMGVQAGQVGMR